MNKKALSVIAATSLNWWGCSHADVLGCLIEPDRVADVGSQSTGVLAAVNVERGDAVKAGQVVARLAAEVERASLSVAEAKARAEAETLQAMAAYDLALRKLERTKDLVKRDFVSDQALDQAEAEARVAEQRVEQARETQRVAQREYHLSDAQLSQREVRSPFAGLVVERYRTEGERIEREPVVRVARIDPLRVEAIVPAAQFGTISAGQVAAVKTDLPDYAVLSARVTLVDRVIDPASNSFRVRLTMPNPGNRIPSGVRCRIAFESGSSQGQATPGMVLPPPAAVGQAAPARWSTVPPWRHPLPEARPRVLTVSAPMNLPPKAPAAVAARPAHFVSSTLKFAMALLARTSPGQHWVDHKPMTLRVAARKPRAPVATRLAMSTDLSLPSRLSRVQDVAAEAPVQVTASRQPDQGAARALPVAGMRLASVR